MEKKNKKFAFILPRCWEGIAGGVEQLSITVSKRLLSHGYDVEILTTCAKDNRSWENHFPEGGAVVSGVPVKRFKVNERNLDSWIPKQLRIQDGFMLSIDEQLEWMAESVNSDGLYEHIASHGDEFDALFFGPYMFGTTFWGSQILPERSFLIPCLHKEVYAETEVFRAMFQNVSGFIFNAAPEMELAFEYFGDLKGGVVGMGFEGVSTEPRERFVDFDSDYLFYLGRKETGKNVHTLVDYFIEGKKREVLPLECKLVIAGPGSFDDVLRPKALERDDIVDIGHVSEDEKISLIQHCTALCQPSLNESFSIVLMEAWIQSVPVIVHGDCAVTKHHVLESGGGLYASSAVEFSFVCKELLENPKLCKKLGDAGKLYVEEVYNWDSVVDRFELVCSELGIL